MSRVGKKKVTVPSGVTVDLLENDRTVQVKGKLGQLEFKLNPLVKVTVDKEYLEVIPEDENNKQNKAIWGTTRAILQNMVTGVSEGFEKKIELNGVGFKMELGSELVVYIGFSHPVKVSIPDNISLKLDKNLLTGSSISKQDLGSFFANLHALKPCDVYKHKGFKFPGKFYRKKVGKQK